MINVLQTEKKKKLKIKQNKIKTKQNKTKTPSI